MNIDECTGPLIHGLVPGVLRVRLIHLEEPTQLVNLSIDSLLKYELREQLPHLWEGDVQLSGQEVELNCSIWGNLVRKYVQSDVSEQVLEVLSELLISKDVIILVLEDLLNGLDIVLFVSSAKLYYCCNLLVVFVDFGLSCVGVVDRGRAEHRSENNVDEDVLGTDVSTFLVKLEALEELLQSKLPLLL